MKPTSSPIEETALWHQRSIQYPRLIAELSAAGAFTPQVIGDLAVSMDLGPEGVKELVARAEQDFESIKEGSIVPPVSALQVLEQYYQENMERDARLPADAFNWFVSYIRDYVRPILKQELLDLRSRKVWP